MIVFWRLNGLGTNGPDSLPNVMLVARCWMRDQVLSKVRSEPMVPNSAERTNGCIEECSMIYRRCTVAMKVLANWHIMMPKRYRKIMLK